MMRRPATPRGWMVLLFAMLLLLPGAAHAHIELDESSPAADEVLSTLPSHLRLLFSARIEGRYTSVTLTAPDGRPVTLGDVVFMSGSDREITLRLPSLTQAGTYVVRWRTAGADGHVLQGSYSFVLAPDSAATPDTAAQRGAVPGVTAPPATVSGGDDPHGHHTDAEPVGVVRGAIGRGLHFGALLLLLGAVTFRVVLLPRLQLTAVTASALQRRIWSVIAGAAVFLAFAAVLRLWSQSISLHGSERAWNTELLSIMLTDTSWGRAWLLQAVLFALLGMAIVWARPGRDRAASVVAVIAVLGLAAIPALSGHAAAATGIGRLIIVNDALHVAGAGAWLGMLAVLMFAGLPAILRLEADGTGAAARAIDTFSPLALAGGAIVMLSGGINALAHFSTLSQLWTTGYGRVLLLKLLFVAGVGAAGFVNWRMVRPRLRAAGGLRRLRLAAGAELLFALLVLTATAVLTGQQRP
ncbi:MAG TPA: copper resistance protein CopC [Longimicrobiales bacterium]|nr:copper resistance protein CopC [Longimicrobiales bacterium]